MPIWAQVVGVVVPVLVAVLGWIGARSAQRIASEAAKVQATKTAELEREKVDREAFTRAQGIYETAIERLDRRAEQDRIEIERQAAALREAYLTIDRQRQELDEYLRKQRRTENELNRLRERLAEIEVSTLHMQEKRLLGDREDEDG